MPEPTLKPREAPAAAPTAPVATGAKPAAEADPKATEGSETLRTLKEIRDNQNRLEKQNRDKDAFIDQLKREKAELQRRGEKPAPDPVKDRLDKALGDLDGGEIGSVIQAEAARIADERGRQMAPHILRNAEEVQRADRGFKRLEGLGVKVEDPRGLAEATRSLSPDTAYVAALLEQGRRQEALDLLTRGKTAEDAEKARAEALNLFADRSPEGRAKLRQFLDVGGGSAPGPRGQTGYMEGEGASLMYEMSLAQHARPVKDLDQWVCDEDYIPGASR